MRKTLLGIVFGLFFLLAACSNVAQGPTEEPSEVDSVTPTAPTVETVTPDEEGYPAPSSEESSPEPAGQEGYPPPSEPLPTRDPYPGGVAFIEHPAGLQCEDPIYPDLRSAEAALEEAGITIQNAEAVELVVCQACGCPTSLHYRISIDPADLDSALSLGWQRGS